MQIPQNDTAILNQYKTVRQALVNLGDQGNDAVQKESYQSSDGGPIPLGSGSTTVQLHPHDRYTVVKEVKLEDTGDFVVKTGSSVDAELSNITLQDGLDEYGRTVRQFTETPGHLDFDQRTYNYGTHINLFEHELIDSSNGNIISHTTGRA